MIKIYHNPRCSKSRQGLEIVEQSGKEFQVIKYLENVPSEKELRELLKYLDIKPSELLRKNEAVWKENYKGKSLTEDQILSALIAHPKLIERPIVVNGNKAIIGRPPEIIREII